MGMMQRPLSPLGAKNSSLRTAFIRAVILLVCIWSLLLLDFKKLSSTVEPVYTGVVESMEEAENGAIRLALGAVPGKPGASKSEIQSAVVAVPSQASSTPSNAGVQSHNSGQDSKGENRTGKDASNAVSESKPSNSAVQGTKEPEASEGTVSSRPLILYAYSESETARPNLQFFIRHALNSAADFVFILNGYTDAIDIIPRLPNINIVQRNNDCYDLGAYAEVLQKNDLWKKHKKFIMLNASLRGPFIPYWSNECWMDMYLGKLTKEVKLVGMTANCWPTFHVQSMIWATDSIGISTLLFPPKNALDHLAKHPVRIPPTRNKEDLPFDSPLHTPTPFNPTTDNSAPKQDATEELKTVKSNKRSTPWQPGPLADYDFPAYNYRLIPSRLTPQGLGINACFHTWDSAVTAEVSSTALIRAAGYKVDVLMEAFHGVEEMERGETCEDNGDVLFGGSYYGRDVSPWETGWVKSNRDADVEFLERLSSWVDRRGYDSFGVCGGK